MQPARAADPPTVAVASVLKNNKPPLMLKDQPNNRSRDIGRRGSCQSLPGSGISVYHESKE